MKRFDFNKFIEEAKKVHGDKYTYLRFERRNGRPYVLCNCNRLDHNGVAHGEFWKEPKRILSGHGCPICSRMDRSMTTETLIERSKSVHNSQYDKLSYEKTIYAGYKKKVIVTCLEHGDFEISIGHLLDGQGCPKCRYVKSSTHKRRNGNAVIEELKKIHPEYDFSTSLEGYVDINTRIPVICHKKDKHGNEHGLFMMHPGNAKNPSLYSGCPKCGMEHTVESKRKDEDVFFNECSIIHNNAYDYSKTNYTYSEDYIYPICPIHGKFKQRAANHRQGQGCPKCANEKSKIEREITDFVSSVVGNENVIENDRKTLDGLEIDIFVKNKNTGFEVDGLIWHSEKFEEDRKSLQKKTELALSKGVKIYHIFEDEWNQKQEIVKSMIRHILGASTNKIYARECEIRDVQPNEAKVFIEKNHIQGNAQSSIRYGLYFNDELVSIMTFGKKRINVGSKPSEGDFELIRFCSKTNTVVIGGASKLFKHFIQNHTFDSITSYCDRRWGFGQIYNILGFTEYRKSEPSYFYTKGKKRINRYNMRKDVLVEKYGCPVEKTEHQWCLENGFYRIYDCGCLCYIWKKANSNHTTK